MDELPEGRLSKLADFSDDVWGTPEQFVEKLVKKLGVKFPFRKGDDFLIYGFEVPSEDDKGKLWVRTNRGGHFGGFWMFQSGRWQRIRDYTFDEVIWKYGDSRLIETGFQLIDGSVQSMDTAWQNQLKATYTIHPDSTPSAPVYRYYATIYLGV